MTKITIPIEYSEFYPMLDRLSDDNLEAGGYYTVTIEEEEWDKYIKARTAFYDIHARIMKYEKTWISWRDDDWQWRPHEYQVTEDKWTPQ